jgi:hypothetical protein
VFVATGRGEHRYTATTVSRTPGPDPGAGTFSYRGVIRRHMTRQRIIAIFFTLMMLFSSIAYAVTLF